MKRSFSVTHCEHISERPFDTVVKTFEGAVGSVEDSGFRSLAAKAATPQEFEALMHSREGTSGFMRFLTLDHGGWMSRHVGVPSRSILYTIGNPLIARTMLKHEVAAGLNVPVRVLIYEDTEKKTRIAYDLPSSLMSVLENHEVFEAAEELDAKLVALAALASGVNA